MIGQDIDCIVESWPRARAALTNTDIRINETGAPADVWRARYLTSEFDVGIDFLQAGEFGPHVISGVDHIMYLQVINGQTSQQVSCLNTTEMLRSKLRSYDLRESYKDEDDAAWIFKHCSHNLRRSRLFDDSKTYTILSSCRNTSKKIREASRPWLEGVRSGNILQ